MMTKPIQRFGVPTAGTSSRIARTLLALYVAGERGILAPDLREKVQTSKPTLYRTLAIVRTAGWHIESTPERVDGILFARLRLARHQKLPREIAPAPLMNRGRTKQKTPPALSSRRR